MQYAWDRSGKRVKLYFEWLSERDHFGD